jgi:hypothetical protein
LHPGVVLGDDQRVPSAAEVLDVLDKPDQNAVVNLTGLALTERPKFFEALLPRIQEMRAKTGRPHWVGVDESHHVMPSSWEAAGLTVSQKTYGLMFITLEPDRVAPAVLSSFDVVIAIGDDPAGILKNFSKAVEEKPLEMEPLNLQPGQAVAWLRDSAEPPFIFESVMPRAERRRHRRKYAEGELRPDLCFYFRGPEGKLNLKAQNLSIFLQIAEGVDDETWLFHLNNGDISRWFLDVIKDPELALEAQLMERGDVNAEESRKHVRSEIEQRYILAA